ncbi:MAG: DNA repair protein RadC [Wenzhouxiangellaceae bacterium]
MTIKDWPTSERPREKLINQGSNVLSDAELLAVILRTGSRGLSAVELARSLLHQFGGLRQIFAAQPADFKQAPGMGQAKFCQLQAALELARRHLRESVVREGAFTSPEITRDYLISHLRDRRREIFTCLFLDTRHRLIACEDLFHGTVDGASVHPRIVVERALANNAAALIAAHNHPSGVTEPSQADLSLTRRLKNALELMDVRLLDHFIVGEGEPLSLAQRGLL